VKEHLGAVAAGHEVTADAAAVILREGGNAFDAALAALFASCVAEPVLSSLGGGGFLLARPAAASPRLYDFFAHTPSARPPEEEIDLYPIMADFGSAQQEFHIGFGSIAVPGVIKGVFRIHRDLCSLPLDMILAPAREAAIGGVRINTLQHYISTVVAPILESSPHALHLFSSDSAPGRIARENEQVSHPDVAAIFDALVKEGEDLFYRGELAAKLVADCSQGGGCLRRADLEQYEVIVREPLAINYHHTQLLTNPSPSLGGTLIAFTLSLLEKSRLGALEHLGTEHLSLLAHAMQLTQQLRSGLNIDLDLDDETSSNLLSSPFLEPYWQTLQEHAPFTRGTTQISIADADGNLASMTLSNGEGSGYVLPGTGIMLNNMLGEEDLNPHGFNHWPLNRRIASMMSPTLVLLPDSGIIATGSGGSNRIRSAILQVLINLIDFGLTLEDAVEQPRIHLESGLLNLEHGIPDATREHLTGVFQRHHCWQEKNLFFGGAHTVLRDGDKNLSGHGDSRRGGVSLLV
jgi:gamma-glutamyltranspeptidase/glutathione hydrolase